MDRSLEIKATPAFLSPFSFAAMLDANAEAARLLYMERAELEAERYEAAKDLDGEEAR